MSVTRILLFEVNSVLKSLRSSFTYNAPKELPGMLLRDIKKGLKGLFIVEGAFSLSR